MLDNTSDQEFRGSKSLSEAGQLEIIMKEMSFRVTLIQEKNVE